MSSQLPNPGTRSSRFLFGVLGATVLALPAFATYERYRSGLLHGNPQPEVPGSPTAFTTKALEYGGMMFQRFHPVHKINMHLCGLQCAADDASEQVIVHRFCAQVNEDLRQCIIFDSGRLDAKLIGIEYIISERLFNALPATEQQLWHSHAHEVASGMLVGSHLPESIENSVVSRLSTTYGKTFLTWQVQKEDPLPLGVPRIMQSFTADGQVRQDLLDRRDLVEGCNTAEKRGRRERLDIPKSAPKHPEADALWHGRLLELSVASKTGDLSPDPDRKR
eukprot:ANDGO_01545.mRNA.1 Oil body-associated protein 1A